MSHPDAFRAAPDDHHRLDAVQRTGLGASADAAFDRFAEMVCAVLNVPVALVALVGADRQVFPGACGLGEPWATTRQTPLSHSFCQHVVADAEPLTVVDARADPRVRDNLAVEDLGVVGYVGAPLTDADGATLGSLCAIDHRPRQWTDRELGLLSDLAAACSDSLRLRIVTETARRGHAQARAAERQTGAAFARSQLLLRASQALAATTTLDEVVDTVRNLVTGVLDPEPAYVGISRLEPGGVVSLASTQHLPEGVAARWARYGLEAATPSALAARTGHLVLLSDLDAVAERAPEAVATFEEMGWQSSASVPLPSQRGPIGALTFVWKVPHRPDASEEAVLISLAGYAAMALTRARVLDDRRTAAATLQKALLTPLPAHGDLRLAARYVPAHHENHVGGDWYDAISFDGHRLALVIGDVVGHSIAAAATMSEYRSMLRTLIVDRQEPPSVILRRLDQATGTLGAGGLATVLLAYLDAAPDGGHVLTWSNAGHPPPMTLHAGRTSLLTGTDPLIGAVRGFPRRDHTVHLPAGSVLILYTDGLVESRTQLVDTGLERLGELLTWHAGVEADQLADLLVDTAASAGQDDVAVLVVETPRGFHSGRTPFRRTSGAG
ncbi:SpoIIE family protein phosphatase [Cryptosporangium minutisporangium]|uniref:PPM-type phosphatase domain-containing protein n=1 Tax=Cryptosporangium minutisporangium TaxID=113569 RepID=A0ABP6T692_9ACTN